MLERLRAKWRRRPFPSNLEALRQCRISYSQFGEDLFLTGLLGYERSQGVYVDIGCFHPVRFSNTYIFYQRGWRGYCIDANPDWSSEWIRYRPEDRYLVAAIAPEPQDLWYVRDHQYPAMNRLVVDGGADMPAVGDPRYSRVAVKAAPLTQVLRQAGTPGDIDLLSIDCEGLDLAILRTLDFTEFRPRVICVEDHDATVPSPTQQFLENKGFVMRAAVGISKVFQRA